MAGVGEGEAGDPGGVGGGHGLGHVGGDEAVVLPVDDQDGDVGVFHGLMAADVPKAEAVAEEKGADRQISAI